MKKEKESKKKGKDKKDKDKPVDDHAAQAAATASDAPNVPKKA